MIKMKSSNARNAGNDLQRLHGSNNAGTFNHGTGEIHNQNYIGGVVGNRQTYTETDEPLSHGNGHMAGGSFDSRERVYEIKQRH